MPEQPDTKRLTVESPRERSSDTENATTSVSDKPGQSVVAETPKNAVQPEPTQPDRGDGKSSSESSGIKAVPAAVPASKGPRNISAQQNQRKSEQVRALDESDSSDEVDICDPPPRATPKKDTQIIGTPLLPKKPATPAAATGSPSRFGFFSRPDNKNTSNVTCHYCPKARCQPAVKTCLVCGASMCPEHLRPHLDSPVFQNHTLVPPLEDISLWRCQDHQEINRIYCRQCGVCVCTVCTVIGSHRDHVCISIREAETELRVSANCTVLYFG